MKKLVGLMLMLAGISSAIMVPSKAATAEDALDICVPEIGQPCVCRHCVYNDDGTCSCPAES